MVFVGKDRRYIVASSSRWAARWHRTGRRARPRTMSDRWDAEQSEFTIGPAILVASPCRSLHSATQHRRSADTQSILRIGLQHIVSCLYSDLSAERFIAREH